jgi:hypothetical protein
MDPAVSGQGGHDRTFEAAATLFRFGLTDAQATVLLDEFNARCVPPWQPHELAHKLTDARAAVEAANEFGAMLMAKIASSKPGRRLLLA